MAMVSLIGLPPTAGFMGKLFLFNAAIQTDLVWLALVGVVNSVLSAYYYMRVIKVMYLEPSSSVEGVPASAFLLTALGLSGLGVLVLGIVPGPLLDAAREAVRFLVW